jgi:hypothetical protein
MCSAQDSSDNFEEPNLNTGTPWSSGEDQDIRWGLEHNQSIEEIADFCAGHVPRFATG